MELNVNFKSVKELKEFVNSLSNEFDAYHLHTHKTSITMSIAVEPNSGMAVSGFKPQNAINKLFSSPNPIFS